MCLTMIDPATGWFEVVELPLTDVVSEKRDVKRLTKLQLELVGYLINAG